jgi:cysteine desulfurase/selenocysteine lyase
MLNTKRIRESFPAIESGRLISNNAASTQIPVQLIDLMREISIDYDNVHRGQSDSSKKTTGLFEASYDTIAQFIGAPSRENVILYRNTTEAINAVMYSLMTEFRDGDNVISTYMEHNSNYVPWYGMAHDILPKFGINVECRLARFDKETGKLDLEHLRSLVDDRTKMICCTGASNFLGTKNPIKELRKIADASGYEQPTGEKKSYLLIDGAQTVPNTHIDVKEMDMDFLVWSFHKMIAPFGIGALYGKKELLESMRPFLYGGDMVDGISVTDKNVGYNVLPWKFTAGTPNILGTILSAQGLRLLLDFSLDTEKPLYYMTGKDLEVADIKTAMDNIEKHEAEVVGEALGLLGEIPPLTIYGPKDPKERTSLVSFNCDNMSPFDIADRLNDFGVESRAGCHCAALAHRYYELNPPSSCRLSFYIYNDIDDVRKACDAVKKITASGIR